MGPLHLPPFLYFLILIFIHLPPLLPPLPPPPHLPPQRAQEIDDSAPYLLSRKNFSVDEDEEHAYLKDLLFNADCTSDTVQVRAYVIIYPLHSCQLSRINRNCPTLAATCTVLQFNLLPQLCPELFSVLILWKVGGLCVWLVDVISREQVWVVGVGRIYGYSYRWVWLESMGVASGYG